MKKTRAELEEIEYEMQRRKERMDATEVRLARTPGGERFLDRMYEIHKTQPLHQDQDPQQGE